MSFWNITAKDLYLLGRDRRTATNLLLLPLAFIAIIGMTTGKLMGWRSSNNTLKIVAIDLTGYDAIGSREFMIPPAGTVKDPDEEPPRDEPLDPEDRRREQNVAHHLTVDIINGVQQTQGVEVRRLDDWRNKLELPPSSGDPVAVAREMIADEKINAALVFTPDFYRRVYHTSAADMFARDNAKPSPKEKLTKAGIEVLTKDPDTSAAGAITAIIGNQARDVIEPLLLYRDGTWTVQQRAAPKFRRFFGSVQRMTTAPPAKLLRPRGNGTAVGNTTYEEIVPSYTVMFVFFLVNLMARSFIAEREIGTLRRLRAAPVSGWSILLGKTLPFLLLSLAQTAILFLAGKLIFGMSWGAAPWLLLPVIFATSCAATGLGLLIATLVRTDSQVSAYATFTVIILAGLSGCFMPRKWLPDAMQQISLATPHAWALIAYDQLLSVPSPSVAVVWQCVGMLLAFAVGFFLLGGWRFRSLA